MPLSGIQPRMGPSLLTRFLPVRARNTGGSVLKVRITSGRQQPGTELRAEAVLAAAGSRFRLPIPLLSSTLTLPLSGTQPETGTSLLVVAGSGKKYWWQCPEAPDHEWEATAVDRTSGRGCPCCRGLKVSVTNSLAALYPDVAALWHPTKNGDITPTLGFTRSRTAIRHGET